MPRPFATLMLLLAALTSSSGCETRIGDPCETSLDCSPVGDRMCDLSVLVHGEGECTVEDCLPGGCPDGSACVETFPAAFLTIPCDPEREDLATCPGNIPDCGPDQALPPLDDCLPHQICLGEGLCADLATARTSCRARCSNDGDCRNAYDCRPTGSRGVYRAPELDEPRASSQTRICMPRPA